MRNDYLTVSKSPNYKTAQDSHFFDLTAFVMKLQNLKWEVR